MPIDADGGRPPAADVAWLEPQDRVQPPEAGIHAAQTLPSGRIEVLPGGHGIWFDQPARCGSLLPEFLLNVERETTP